MSCEKIFQESVLKKYADKQDKNLVKERWKIFQVFLSKTDRIKKWIESDYQVGFLEDVFENCLGYVSKTKSIDESFTLDREKKNIDNAQKADGALLIDGKVRAVIELKDQKTKDLEKKYSREKSAVEQAFGYLEHQPTADFVIVSNFDELRFYGLKRTACKKFSLFNLKYEGFKKLHTILSYESIKENLPEKIQKQSLIFEKDITDKLYKEYSQFRIELFESIKQNNQISELKALTLTQKLLDRIIFILFAEDTKKLPINSISTIINQYQKESFDGWVQNKPLYY